MRPLMSTDDAIDRRSADAVRLCHCSPGHGSRCRMLADLEHLRLIELLGCACRSRKTGAPIPEPKAFGKSAATHASINARAALLLIDGYSFARFIPQDMNRMQHVR